jgi:enolase
MHSKIREVVGSRIWDSRGRPTVEVEVTLACGAKGRGIAPAGASRGKNEAVDLRDGGSILGGFGVDRAVANVNGPIAKAILDLDAIDQQLIDRILVEIDQTVDRSKLGGNAMIATSMAVLHAAAAAHGVSLWRYLAGDSHVKMPLPQIQIFGGGAHAGRRTDIQDFLIMPVGAHSFDEAMSMAAEVYRSAGELLRAKGSHGGVADEGGWWPDFESNEEALEMVVRAIDNAGYRNGEVLIALDIAASEFGSRGVYKLALEKREFDTDGWLALLLDWVDRYPIASVEDPVGEDDPDGMRAFTRAVGDRIQVVGDDFLVTNAERITAAARGGQCNAVLIKPNQAGTITESRQAVDVAKRLGWGTIVSARSGESEDVIVAHLATGWNTGQIKVGSFARSERMAKWNELLRIERQLGSAAHYDGRSVLPAARRQPLQV